MTTAEEQLRTTSGQPFGDEHASRLRSGRALRMASVRRNAPPIDEDDIVEIVAPVSPAPGELAVCLTPFGYEVRRLVRAFDAGWLARTEPAGDVMPVAHGAIVGVVAAVEHGDIRIDLRRRRWRAWARVIATLPSGASGVGGALSALERLRRPLFPPVSMGSPAALMRQVREAYDREAAVLAADDALSDAEHAALVRWLRPGMRLLDVGAGTGREAIAFARAGLDVTAIDVSERMIDRAREHGARTGVAVTFEVAEPATYEPPHGFDAVYLGTGVYNHIPSRNRRLVTLRHLTRLLELDGFIVLAPVLFPPLPLLSRARVVDGIRRVLRALGGAVAEPGDTYHRGFALAAPPASFRFVHRFTRRTEIEREVAEAGLVVLDRLDDAAVWKVGRGATALR